MLRSVWAVFGQCKFENQTKSKLVESFLIACLDAGSNPADSTNLIPNMFNINVLGFFIIDICTIIVRLDIKSQKNLA